MISNPIFFTYENLSSLKFKELQKLSMQFCVNRRWAKKQDLINNLLALKHNKASNNGTTLNVNEDEEKEWKDGNLVFKDLKENTFAEDDLNKRLTYNITHKSEIGPFEVPQNGKNSLSINDENVGSRKTYDIPPSEAFIDVQSSIDASKSIINPSKKLSTEESDSRATFNIIQNKNESLGKNEYEVWETTKTGSIHNGNKLTQAKDLFKKLGSEKDCSKLTFGSFKGKKSKCDSLLTIPLPRITRRMRKAEETIKKHNSSLKMSKISVNIKKSSDKRENKLVLMKSPKHSTSNKSVGKQTILQPLTEYKVNKTLESKIPLKLQPRKEKLMQKGETSSINKNNKANVIRNLSMKSKTTEEILVEKSNTVKVSLMSSPVASTKNPTVNSAVKKVFLNGNIKVKPGSGKFNLQTPSKTAVTKKSLTAIKMPDFRKIHQKQFEQMDSLHEYMQKKKERTKRLFGTPQPTPQSKVPLKPVPMFRFQSTVNEKSEVKFDNKKSISEKKTNYFNKENNAKYVRLETFKKKLPPTKSLVEIKDKNRSLILGVRTNKRFELQMKLRKM